MQRAGEAVFLPAGTFHATRNIGDAIAVGAQAPWQAPHRLAHAMSVLRGANRRSGSGTGRPAGSVVLGAGEHDVAARIHAAIGFAAILKERSSGVSAGAGGAERPRAAAQRRRMARAAVKQLLKARELAPLCLRAHFALLDAMQTLRDLDPDACNSIASSVAGATQPLSEVAVAGDLQRVVEELTAFATRDASLMPLIVAAHQRLGVWYAKQAGVLARIATNTNGSVVGGCEHGRAETFVRDALLHLCEKAAAMNPLSASIARDCRAARALAKPTPG